jgi:hypothetical protein
MQLVKNVFWQNCWNPGMWSCQKQALLGSSMVTTHDLAIPMRYAPFSNSNMYARNSRSVGSGILCGSVQRLYLENQNTSQPEPLHGSKFKYLHYSPASHRSPWKGNSVPGGITGPPWYWWI